MLLRSASRNLRRFPGQPCQGKGSRVRQSHAGHDQDQPVEDATIVAEEMVRWLRDIEGFDGFLMLTGEGSAIGLTFWESREVAARHQVARGQFIERMLSIAGVEIEERADFEVAFAERWAPVGQASPARAALSPEACPFRKRC